MTDEDVIENDAVKLLQDILKEAKSDGVLSEDEKNIIDIIQRHLWDLESEIELAMQDGKNTPEMIDHLKSRLQDILGKAREVANEDGKITEDEKALLDKLEKYVKSDNITGLLTEYIDKFL